MSAIFVRKISMEIRIGRFIWTVENINEL